MSVTPICDEDGYISHMLIETDTTATRCYTPQEVDTAVDIAIFRAQQGGSIYTH